MLRIRLAKSPIGHTANNRATVKALGLRKVHQIVEHDDSPAIRGMIHRVKNLLVVETVEGERTKKKEVAPKPAKAEKPAKTEKPAKAEAKAPASAKPKKAAAPKAPKAKE
jgi:large subunit ribosomal protein L30